MTTLFSIVIPTYNRARDLERALKSIIAQTYPHWEALVVDNHSTDDTDELVKGLHEPRITVLKIHNNGIIAASRNLGIRHARGEYVAFLDSDDWWTPQKLELSLTYLNHGADLVYHDLFIAKKLNQRFYWKKLRARGLKVPVFNDLLARGNALGNSSVVVRKKLLDAVNGLSEDRDLVAAEDYDAWLRIAKLTEKFKKIPKTLGYYWAGGGNMSNPGRTFKTLEVLEERYAQALGQLKNVFWFYYARGRLYYLLGSYEEAKKNLRFIYLQQVPVVVFFKSCWMLLMMKLCRDSKRVVA